jgi:hypothetical protein
MANYLLTTVVLGNISNTMEAVKVFSPGINLFINTVNGKEVKNFSTIGIVALRETDEVILDIYIVNQSLCLKRDYRVRFLV